MTTASEQLVKVLETRPVSTNLVSSCITFSAWTNNPPQYFDVYNEDDGAEVVSTALTLKEPLLDAFHGILARMDKFKCSYLYLIYYPSLPRTLLRSPRSCFPVISRSTLASGLIFLCSRWLSPRVQITVRGVVVALEGKHTLPHSSSLALTSFTFSLQDYMFDLAAAIYDFDQMNKINHLYAETFAPVWDIQAVLHPRTPPN